MYYEKNTGLLISGLFYFLGTNTWEINMTETNAIIPSNINIPKLENIDLSPTIGNLTTNFKFTVNYSDADNNMPTSINVIINDTVYSMSKQNLGDTNYTDGVIYEYQTFLNNGTYNYYYNVTDGKYSISYPIGELQLIVQEDPNGGNGGDNTLIIIIGITAPIACIAVAVTIILIKRKKAI